MDLRTALRIVRRNTLLILLCVITVTAVAYLSARAQQKQYSATAILLFHDPGYAEILFGSSSAPAQSTDPLQEAATDLNLVSLQAVAARTASALKSGLTASGVAAKVAVGPEGQSNNVSITATDANPDTAARLATTYAQQFIGFRRDAARAQLVTAEQVVQQQLRSLPGRGTGPAGAELRNRADELQVLAALQTGNAELVQSATVPGSPSSPKPTRTAAIGFVLSLILAALVVLLRERLDRRLRDSHEAEEIFQRPVLGSIPESQALRSNPWQLPAAEREAFMMLSTSLRYFDVKQKIETVLLTSAASGDGKTTLAHDLAAATALGGRRVLLIEADLRRGDLAERLGLPHETGLSDVLAGHVDWQDCCARVSVSGPDQGSGGVHFDVLPAGTLPPNPTDLISSPRMSDILVEAKDSYQLIVIDTPPTPVISDAIPLLSLVDGVLGVVRLGRTTRDGAHQLQRQLERLGAPLLGIVINSVTKVTGYGYSDTYGYETSAAAESHVTTLAGAAASTGTADS